MKDKFWNFIFYKFIFVFGIVNVQYLHEIVLWVSWFSALGFLHLMSQLCKDRFEYVSLQAEKTILKLKISNLKLQTQKSLENSNLQAANASCSFPTLKCSFAQVFHTFSRAFDIFSEHVLDCEGLRGLYGSSQTAISDLQGWKIIFSILVAATNVFYDLVV